MAVLVRTLVGGVDRTTHDQLEQEINRNIGRAGGPPAGLMAHMGYPEGSGLVIVEVFGTEAGFLAFWAEVIAPAIASLGLDAGEHDVKALWSFARP